MSQYLPEIFEGLAEDVAGGFEDAGETGANFLRDTAGKADDAVGLLTDADQQVGRNASGILSPDDLSGDGDLGGTSAAAGSPGPPEDDVPGSAGADGQPPLPPDDDAGSPTAPPAGAPSSTGGWTGAGYVESSSPEEEAAYDAIRANDGDVPKISDNTGVSEDVVGQVKNHLFMTEHDVPLGPDDIAHGYFTADGRIAELWNKAEAGTLSPDELGEFRTLMAHEYVESRLMESGMPYRSADPEAWDGDTHMFNPSHVGAHDVAPVEYGEPLRLWRQIGLTAPDSPIAPDLSNIDDVVRAAREGLGL